MNNNNIPDFKVITLDGPAASGKGTLAKRLAQHLDYFYLDTGAIYRLVGLKVLKAGIEPENNEAVVAEIAASIAENFVPSLLNDPELKSDHAGQMASRCGALPSMRQAIEKLQRDLAGHPPTKQNGSVLDGRDTGTVICPDAAVKIFITAETDIRAERRYKELQSRGLNTSFDAVLNDMQERDKRDSDRSFRPLKPAEDAVIIDTTKMTQDEAFSAVLQAVS